MGAVELPLSSKLAHKGFGITATTDDVVADAIIF